jgi:hypothetical protein
MHNGSETSREIIDSTYGALFFGVPNQGMDIKSLVPMVQDQPNHTLLYSLGTESQILRNQCRQFPIAFDKRDSEIICFYETVMSPTAIQVSTTTWTIKVVVVVAKSANRRLINGV